MPCASGRPGRRGWCGSSYSRRTARRPPRRTAPPSHPGRPAGTGNTAARREVWAVARAVPSGQKMRGKNITKYPLRLAAVPLLPDDWVKPRRILFRRGLMFRDGRVVPRSARGNRPDTRSGRRAPCTACGGSFRFRCSADPAAPTGSSGQKTPPRRHSRRPCTPSASSRWGRQRRWALA